MRLLGEESPYYADDKWDLTLVNAGPAFAMGALGEGVRVGILDSGVNPLPCLADSLLPGRSYIEGDDENNTADSYGHGTLVAALIAGQDADGCIGAAPGAEIVPLKITDAALVSEWAVKAMRWAVDADIINGVGNDLISPRTQASRAQVATMLMRFAADK